MTVQAFVDTNVLVYAASNRSADQRKKLKANELIGGQEFGVSGQVLAEFYSTVTRKGDPPMPAALALEWVELLELQACASVDARLVKRGAEISERYHVSYWDGAIVAAAEVLGATTLYTEDLNHGQLYSTVTVHDPFRGM